MKYIYLILTLLLMGCSNVVYVDRNITINNSCTIIKTECPICEVCNECKPCDICPQETKIAQNDERTNQIIKLYAECSLNNSNLQNQINNINTETCISDYSHCNNSLTDCIDRLDMIKHYAVDNR